MSHFTVMVVTAEKPSQTSISEVLQPFHEFECSGVADQYVVNVDMMEEARIEYEKDTERMYRDTEGKHHNAYSEEFYRDPTPEEKIQMGREPHGTGGNGAGLSWSSRDWGDGSGYHTRVHFLPEGWTEVDLPTPDVKSFGSFIEGWYGYKRLGENDIPDLEHDHKYGWYRENANGDVIEVINRTNPNKHWDWWVIGGRWSGMIHLKPGILNSGAWNGERSCFDDSEQMSNTFDSARKGDIDIEGMRLQARVKAALKYDEVRKVIDPFVSNYVTWEDMRSKHTDIKKAREEYHAQEIIVEFKKIDNGFFSDIDPYMVDRETYLENIELKAFTTFALLMDGKWAERGKMGWWASVSNEDASWEKNFATILDSIPDDHWLTIVDCHN